MTGPGRLGTLAWISRQLQDLVNDVVLDVSQNRDGASGTEGGGFIAYSLQATNREPLRDVTIAELEITVDNIVKTTGYVALAARCESLKLNLRLDRHFYSDHPQPSSIYRVIIDGWR